VKARKTPRIETLNMKTNVGSSSFWQDYSVPSESLGKEKNQLISDTED